MHDAQIVRHYTLVQFSLTEDQIGAIRATVNSSAPPQSEEHVRHEAFQADLVRNVCVHVHVGG
jgi:hypothetical protein